MIVQLPDIKDHLRVDGDQEDALLSGYAHAAEEQVRDWIGRPFYARQEDLPAVGEAGYDRYQIVATRVIHVSIKILVERMYSNRGGEGADHEAAVPPMTVRALLAGLRVFHRMPAPPEEAEVDSDG